MRASSLLRVRRLAQHVAAPPVAATRIGFVGVGGRANAIVARLMARGPEPHFSFALVTDDQRAAGGAESVCVGQRVEEAEHGAQVASLLAQQESELSQSLSFGEAVPPQVAFVVADLGEGLSLGAAPVVGEHLRARAASLTLGVALLPFSFGGHVLNERARAGLRALKKSCDSVIVFDSSNLRQEGLQAATFYDLHETFLDMCASNLHALTLPLIRKNATLRISLANFRRLFAPEAGRGRETRLVCAQLQSSDAAGNRGKLVLQKVLTDEFFPLDDVSQAFGVLIAVDAAKDLTYAEIEQIYTVENYLSDKALVTQGLTYVDTPGVHVTMAVVGGTVLNAEEQELERQEQLQEEERRAREKKDLWKRFQDWL